MKEQDIRKRDILDRYINLVEEDIKELFSSKKEFIRVNCPACGADEYAKQFEKQGFQYVLCVHCGTLFANPRPSVKSLIDFYTGSKSAVYWVEEFFKPMAEARRSKMFQPRANFVNEKFSGAGIRTVGDIGAGFGIFLEELAKLWPAARLVAIEPSPEMVAICRQKGLAVIPKAIEEVEGWEGKFDFLTAFELFEHLFDPGEFLDKVRDFLAPGGRLLLTTLNGEGFDIQVLWERAKGVMPPHHLNFFNPGSITSLLQTKGFIVEDLATPGELDWDIVEGRIMNDGVKVERFWHLLSEKGTVEAKQLLQNWIQQNLLSSHMRVIARKTKGK